MKSISLQEHIAQSKIAVAANKAKGNRHGQILSMLYSDPFHFIEELLQNAEDAYARRGQVHEACSVKIVFAPDGIDFLHNGDPFNEADLMSITTFASTTKKGLPDINQIGKFGIGFRSVYGITDCPEIHSGIHHYRITDFEVLNPIEPEVNSEFSTRIHLPYASKVDTSFMARLKKNIFAMNPRFLLFLKHIAQVEITDGEKSRIFTAEEEKTDSGLTLKTIRLYQDSQSVNLHYLLHGSKRVGEVAIALRVDESQRHFLPEEDQTVSVFFPTQFRMEHRFLVHGKFTTTPNRESIPFSKEWTPENEKILTSLSVLLQSFLKNLQRNELLNASFYQLFSWHDGHTDPVSASIHQSLTTFLQSEKCLFGASGTLFQIEGLCLPEDEWLPTLLQRKELREIYNRFDFIHQDYLELETFIQTLRKHHKLKLADIDTLAFHIGRIPAFLQKKPVQYFKSLYALLSNHPRLWDLKHQDRYYNLRRHPLVPDQRKKVTAAFAASGQAQIFIGQSTQGIATVHPELANDFDSVSFLRMLGLPDTAPALSEAETLLRKFNTANPNAWWLKIFNLYQQADASLRQRIVAKLTDMECVPAIHSQSGEKTLCRPKQAYLRNGWLEKFFLFHPVYFVHEQHYRYFSQHATDSSTLNAFLNAIGVNDSPMLVSHPSALSEEQKKALREGREIHPIVRETVSDFLLDGLSTFLSNPSPAASVALWKLLSQLKPEFRQATYTYESYVRNETTTFKARYIELLEQTPWLFDSNWNAVKPVGFPVSSLQRQYAESLPESLWMADAMGMTQGGMSEEDQHMLALLRQFNMNRDTLKDALSPEKQETIFYPWTPDSVGQATPETFSPDLFSSATLMARHTAIHSFGKRDWFEHLLSSHTDETQEYLLKEIFQKSKTISIERVHAGLLRLCDNKIVLQHVFIGARPADGEPVLFHPAFQAHLSERPSRKDTRLFVYNKQDQTCVEIKPELLERFLQNNCLAYIQINDATK